MVTPVAHPLLRGVRAPTRVRSSHLVTLAFDEFVAEPSPDPALITGRARLHDRYVYVFAQQKPSSLEMKAAAACNFGMMSAAGYWHVVALLERLASEAVPVVSLIDTPGADPSRRGVEDLLAWSISACISAFIATPCPTVSMIIGEGGSGGALALQVADRRLIASDAMYSVISPESCSAILFRDADHVAESIALLRPGAEDARRIGLVDEIVDWAGGVALEDHARAAARAREALERHLDEVCALAASARVKRRRDALLACGEVRATGRRGDAVRAAAPVDGALAEQPKLQRMAELRTEDAVMGLLQHAYFSADPHSSLDGEGHRFVCPRSAGGCGAAFTAGAFRAAVWSCPACGRGERLSAAQWLDLLTDDGSFEELYADLDLSDLADAGFDTPEYRAERERTRARTGCREALRVGIGRLDGVAVAFAVSEFRFMGGTLGAVCGEKIRRIVGVALHERLPLVCVTSSGGARMQEGTLALVQMAKTNAALLELSAAGLPFVSIVADPCTGGALGSYATAATAVLAEPGALLAFAGPRVMKLAGLAADEKGLRSERYAQHGGADEVVERARLKQRLARTLDVSGGAVGSRRAPPLAGLQRSEREAMNALFSLQRRITELFDDLELQRAGASGTDAFHARLVTHLSDLALVTVPMVLEQATRSEDPRVRANAIEALARFPSRDRARLLSLLGDPHHRVRANAAVALLESGDEREAVEAVLAMLDDGDPVVRRAGLYAAVRVPRERWLDRVAHLCSDGDVHVQAAAAVAAFACGDDARARAVVARIAAPVGPFAVGMIRRLSPYLPPARVHAFRELLEEISTRTEAGS